MQRVGAVGEGVARNSLERCGSVASVGFDVDDWEIWDALSGELHMVVATHDGTGATIGGLRAVAFSPCGQRLAT